MIATASSVYKDVSSNHNKEFLDYDSVLLSDLAWIPQKDVTIVKYVDSGRFSSVFEGKLKMNSSSCNSSNSSSNCGGTFSSSSEESVVLKVLKSSYIGKIKREIKLLQLLYGTEGVIKLLGLSKNSGCQTVTLMFENLGVKTQWLSNQTPAGKLSKYEVKLLSYKLLRALNACHSKGVMHRDVKSRNVLYNKETLSIRLIDFGLSDLYFPMKKYNPSVASRHYKAPELLFGYLYYDYAIDVWSAGCLIAGLLFDMEPFICGIDAMDQISAVAAVVGSEQILNWVTKYSINISSSTKNAIGNYPKVSLKRFCTPMNAEICTADAIDLLDRMLLVDHKERITVSECLLHPFFDTVRF